MSEAAQPCVIGRRLFTDGVEREVFEDADGRQWVIGHDSERAYGVWLPPPDEPLVVITPGRPRQAPRTE